MKKYLFVLITILLLTGCGKSLTCTKSVEEEDYKTEEKIVFDVNKDNKVSDLELNYTMIFEDETIAKDYLNILDSFKNDYEIEQKKNKITIKSEKDYTEYNQTKEELKKDLESNGYTCK